MILKRLSALLFVFTLALPGLSLANAQSHKNMSDFDTYQKRVTQEMAKLQETLQINDTQRPYWQAYVNSLQAKIASMRQAHQAMKAEHKHNKAGKDDLSAPQRLAKRIERMQAKIDLQKQQLNLTKNTQVKLKRLYARLDRKQKAKLDTVAKSHHHHWKKKHQGKHSEKHCKHSSKRNDHHQMHHDRRNDANGNGQASDAATNVNDKI